MPKFDVPARLPIESGGQGAPQTQSLSTTATYIGLGFCAEATIDVKKVGFYATAAGSGGQTLNVTIETINTADGLPSGTAIVSTTTTVPLTVGWNELTFATSGTLNAGTMYMIKLQMATNPTTAPTIAYAISQADESFVPYTVITGTRSANRVVECFYIVDSAGGAKYYGWPFWLSATQTTNQLNVNNALPEIGMRFKIPTTVCSTYKVVGLKFAGDPNASASDIVIGLYDWNSGNNSTALDTKTMPSYATANTTQTALMEYYFDNPPTLTAGSDYIAAIATSDATSATIPVAVRLFQDTPDATKPALFDQTANYTWDRVSRTSTTGSWTTTANQTLEMKLICEIVSLPSGGGGYSANFNQGFGQ
jgi:hypothetical protein